MASSESTIGALLDDTGGSIKTGPFGTKLKASEYTPTGVPVISVGEVGFGRLRVHDDTPRVDETVSSRMPEFLLKAGDIVFGRKGAVERSAQVQPDEDGYFLGSDGIRIRLNVKACDPKFISYQLQTMAHRSWMIQHAAGTTMPSLNEGIIRRIPIVLKPLPEQKAIAAVLGALDDKIELNRRMNATLESMARALFQSWFVDFDPVRAKLDGRPSAALDPATAAFFPDKFEDSAVGHIPHGWSIGKITDCCDRIHSGGTPRRDEPEYWENGKIPWLTSGEVRQPMITATENFISEMGLRESSAKWVPANSTVVALYGATAGQVSFLGTTATTNQAVCSLIPKSGFEFFNYFSMRGATADMESKAVGSAQQNISKGIIEETLVVLPSAVILTAFTMAAEPLFRRWIANIEQSRTLATLRDTLLPKLLSGELSVAGVTTAVESVLR